MRYISAETYCRSGRDSAMLVRGACDGGHFELEPRPNVDFSPEAMAAMTRAVTFPRAKSDQVETLVST